MKVFLRYEDHDNTALHKTLKITLPKSWKNGPTSRLLTQFVESYNSNETLGSSNPLKVEDLHLELQSDESQPTALASDSIVIEVIPDRSDIFVVHGASLTLQEIEDAESKQREEEKERLASTVACTHFGCKNRFPKGGPYPSCSYHKSPPVFHETAKFWSCCPNKKAYDWEDFQRIPGCQTGVCTDKKEEDQKQFLGGTDLRAQAGEASALKSIDDFNKSQAAGGSDAAPVLDRLKNVLGELGVEEDLYNQVVLGMRRELGGQEVSEDDPELLSHVAAELGSKLKTAMKAIAVEQLRIK